MKIEDLKQGDIYVNLNGPYINKVNGFNYNSIKLVCYVDIKLKKFKLGETSTYSNIRAATSKEKAWLLQCERAGKFIPLEQIEYSEIVNNYELY